MSRKAAVLSIFAFVLPGLVLAGSVAAQSRSRPATEPVQVGFVFDGEWGGNARIHDLITTEILELTEGEFDLRLDPAYLRTADWSQAGVQRELESLLDDPEVDLVIATGVVASALAARHPDLPKPVIAPFILDHELQELPLTETGSGRRNLSYISMPRNVERDIEAFREIVPFQHLTLLPSVVFAQVVPGLPMMAAEIERSLGVEVAVVEVGDSAVEALAQIPAETDAVYVMPQLLLGEDGLRELVAGLNDRRLPSFALLGRQDVELGVMLGLNPDIFPRLARRIALNVQSILLGERPEDLGVAFASGERLTINMATAEAIDAVIPWSAYTEADRVGEVEDAKVRVLDLATAVESALQTNPGLRAAALGVRSGEQAVRRARSPLLPQSNLSLSSTVIDEDRAAASFGSAPERAIRVGADLSQVLFSDEAWAGYTIAGHRQRGVEAAYESDRLDLAQTVATAYLQLLSAKTIERIQRENVQLTRSHLELARVREFVGQSGPGEVLRLESQLAIDVQAAIDANAVRNLAEIEVNRLLDRPLEEGFDTVEPGLDDPSSSGLETSITRFFTSKRVFGELRHVLAEAGKENSPELREIDAAMLAQARGLETSTRAFWLPSLGLSADLTELVYEDGAGADVAPLFGKPADETDWSVAVGLSFPLLKGGDKPAARQQAKLELERLKRQREALQDRIEQRVRASLHRAGASWAAITQTRRAAGAAAESQELVTDAYGRGVVDVLDLLDAQSTARTAQLRAAAAVYAFLVDLMEVERAVGANQYVDEQALQELILRCEAHFESVGISIPPR